MSSHALPILLGGVLIGMALPAPTYAEPPPPERTMPGDVVGRTKSWWLAPYVSITNRSLGSNRWTGIQWFDSEGRVTRELAGSNVFAQGSFAFQQKADGSTIVHAINGNWKIDLPKKAGPAGYVTGADRTFIHEFHPTEGEIASDIYVSGKRVATIGPYTQIGGEDVRPGTDGSLALLTWPTIDKKARQIVAAGPDGRVQFQVECDEPSSSPTPAPGGTSVLVRMSNSESRNTFALYQKKGKRSSLNVGPNTEFVTWLPGTTIALMETSIGHDLRWHLIDWETGKRRWEIGDPSTARVPGSDRPVAVAGNLLLIAGLEFINAATNQKAGRSIYALDVKNGAVVGHWLPSATTQPSSDCGRLVTLGDQHFLVTEEEFAEIHLDDIAAKTNGWK